MPIFRVKSVKIYTGQKNLHWRRQPRQWQLSGMPNMRYLYSSGTSLVPYLWAWFVWQPHLSTTCQGGVAISEHWSYDVLIFFIHNLHVWNQSGTCRVLNFILPKSKMKTFEHCCRVPERGSWYSCREQKDEKCAFFEWPWPRFNIGNTFM